MEMTRLKEQIRAAKASHVYAIGQILLEIGRRSEAAAQMIEQDLENEAMSLEACGKALYDYAKKNQKGGSWACAVFGLEPQNPVIQIVLDFYKIPSAWVFEQQPDAAPVTAPAHPEGVIDLMELL